MVATVIELADRIFFISVDRVRGIRAGLAYDGFLYSKDMKGWLTVNFLKAERVSETLGAPLIMYSRGKSNMKR